MKFLPEMCFGPKDRPLHFGDNQDSESGLLSGSLGGGMHFEHAVHQVCRWSPHDCMRLYTK